MLWDQRFKPYRVVAEEDTKEIFRHRYMGLKSSKRNHTYMWYPTHGPMDPSWTHVWYRQRGMQRGEQPHSLPFLLFHPIPSDPTHIPCVLWPPSLFHVVCVFFLLRARPLQEMQRQQKRQENVPSPAIATTTAPTTAVPPAAGTKANEQAAPVESKT